jgi:hypothetical protein
MSERPVAAVGGLVVMITWTLVVKYLAPLLWGLSAGVPAPVMWDFWPLAHGALATLLWRRHRWAWSAAVAIATLEILIVAWKLGRFALHPQLEFWRLLWATNKIYVLVYFLALLAWLFFGAGRRLRWAAER